MRTQAQTALADLAAAVSSDARPCTAERAVDAMDGSARSLARVVERETVRWRRPRERESLAHVQALIGQLRACVEIVTEGGIGDLDVTETTEAIPAQLRPRGALDILRANLTWRSAALRHAVRLALCLAVAGALGHGLGLQRAYWVPMTAAIVLRPDFVGTTARGLGRMLGTLIGLGVASGLAYAAAQAHNTAAASIAVIAILTFLIRAMGSVNYTALAAGITVLVVVLTALAGSPPETTIIARGENTLIGGALALLAYVVWPTWERMQAPAILADLLDAYRRYFDAVADGLLDCARFDRERVYRLRLEARLARTNATSSLDRLRQEPLASGAEVDTAEGVLASSHRFIRSAMALEARLYDPASLDLPPEFRVLAAHVDETLEQLTQRLRDPGANLAGLPDLRADQEALEASVVAGVVGDVGADAARAQPSFTAETERIVNSLNTILHLLRESGGPDAGRATPVGRAVRVALEAPRRIGNSPSDE